HFREQFGRSEVYQLPPGPGSEKRRHGVAQQFHGRFLFGEGRNWECLEERLLRGAAIKKTKLSKEFDYADFRQRHGDGAVPLYVLSGKGQVQFATLDKPRHPTAGQTLVSLMDPDSGEGGNAPAADADGAERAGPANTPAAAGAGNSAGTTAPGARGGSSPPPAAADTGRGGS
ncbi:MAG: hypothetical protein KDM81_18535, partial [Verrucomicrobiae bacterium]|nr:hypothetical protein [Verrucomicrobiae bacterium]